MRLLVFAVTTTTALFAAAIHPAMAMSHADEISSYALLLTDASMAVTNCGYKFNIPEMSHVTADLHIQRPQDQQGINAAEAQSVSVETESMNKDTKAWCTTVWNRFGPNGTSVPMVLIKQDPSERPAQ
jgi:hypothetical protein